MNSIRSINKLFDAIAAKDVLIQKFSSFVGESNANLISEGVTLTSSILNFICYIKDEIEKGNKDKRTYEMMNFKLKGALDLSIEDCKALKYVW